MSEPTDLVYIDDCGLLGSNFYWHNYAALGLTEEDIARAGLTNERVRVSSAIVEKLMNVDSALAERGWRFYIKEGYRSRELYDIVYKRRVEHVGRVEANALLNMKDRPHATGRSVDVAIWDPVAQEDVRMRNISDDTASFFIGYYKGREDTESIGYQELQDYLAGLMLTEGFRIGTRREYFHFDYRPDTPANYYVD